ncbi:MAG: hypothetical protein IPJ77_14375 [Planctomycetes bacterium]|nr:hypothetical protein [Planctomycetota bacterium]
MSSAFTLPVSSLLAIVAGLPIPISAFACSDPELGRVATVAVDVKEDGPAREHGTLGTLAPQAGDVRLADVLVHQDTRGGNQQALQALASSVQGAAAVWRDHRDGMMGLYLRRVDGEGAAREPEQSIHAAHSGRRRDPAVALAPDGSGAVAWTSVAGGKNTVFLRLFDAAGQFTAVDQTLVAPADARQAAPGETVRDGGDRQPALAVLGDGRVVAAWNKNGSVVVQEFDARGKARAPARVLNPGADDATVVAGAIRLVGLERDALCLWNTSGGGEVLARRASNGKPAAVCAGRLEAACGDGRGGAWIVAREERAPTELLVHHLDARAERVAADTQRLALGVVPTNVELACAASGLLLAAEGTARAGNASARRGAGREPEANVLELHRAPSAGAFELLPNAAWLGAEAVRASDVHVASIGARFLVAWTDERNGDPDVFTRTLDAAAAPESRFGALVRLNSDAVSADQGHPRAAASGAHAVVAWHDARDVAERVFVRRLAPGPDGVAFTGPELELPVDESRDARARPVRQLPEVALAADGALAVAWRDLDDAGETLQLQLLKPDSSPVTPHVAVDPGERTLGALPCALVTLPEGRGYVLAWPRPGGSVWTRRVLPSGAFASAPREVGRAKDAETLNPSLCVLDDGRLVCAWDVQAAGRPPKCHLRARFLDRDGVPQGDELAFEPSMFGIDWDPSVAPAPKGGFVMAWCAGAPNDPGRDVFARAFDAQGRPDGPFLPLSTLSNEQDWPSIVRLDDGTWAVAWEDDLSGHDQTYVRRILASKRELGPVRCMNELDSKVVPDRVLPSIAPWNGGWIATWGDRRRSLGWDVYAKVAGPRFDAIRPR